MPVPGGAEVRFAASATRVGHGVPRSAARLLLGSFHASRRGEFAVTDPTLATSLGREPRRFGDALRVPATA